MMNWFSQINWQIFYSAALGSGLIGLILKVAEKVIDQRLEESKESKGRKKEIIESAMKIISEAESSNFKEPPRDKEHTIHINNKLATVDEKLRKYFNSMILSWDEAQINRLKAADLWHKKETTNPSKKAADSIELKIQAAVDKMETAEAQAYEHLNDATERATKLLS